MRFIKLIILIFLSCNLFAQIQGTGPTNQGNVPLHNLRHSSGPEFVIRSGVGGKAEWIKDSIYFPKYFNVASAPLIAKKGDFWRSTANQNTYFWDGIDWRLLAKKDTLFVTVDTTGLMNFVTNNPSKLNKTIITPPFSVIARLFNNDSNNGIDLTFAFDATAENDNSVGLNWKIDGATKRVGFSGGDNYVFVAKQTKLSQFDPENILIRMNPDSIFKGNLAILGDTMFYRPCAACPIWKSAVPVVAHVHTISNITNLQDSLNARAKIVHTHVINDVAFLQDNLNLKSNVNHTHDDRYYTETQSDSLLSLKANTSHTHSISNVTNLQDSLLIKAPIVHGHTIGQVTGLQDSLNARPNETTATIQAKRPIKTIESQSLEGSGNIDINKLSEAYKSSIEINPNPLYTPRDGANVIVKDDVIHIFGGWNENGVLADNHYSSSDGGLTWEQEDNAPFGPRHTFGIEKLGDYYYAYGTDYQAIANTGNKGVWRSTDLYNWTEINANPPWGYIWLYGTCVHNGYLYFIGGHLAESSLNPSKSNKVWRSVDGITWVEYSSNLPEGGGVLTGQVISHLGALWLVCPSNYADDIEDRVISNKIYKSTDDGLTWVESGVHPFPTQYANMFKHNGKVYYRAGVGFYPALLNTNKLFYTFDMVRWYEIPNTGLNVSHATCIGIYDNNIYEFAGNLYNDISMIEIVDVGSIDFDPNFTGLIGEGTATKLATWAEDNELTESEVYYKNLKIGIGVIDPETKLDVNGPTQIRGYTDIKTDNVYNGIRRVMPSLNHGVTNKLPTNVAWSISDYSGPNYPNMYIAAIGNSSFPVVYFDAIRLDNPNDRGFMFTVGTKSGNSTADMSSNANLFQVANNDVTKFSVFGNGDIEAKGNIRATSIPSYATTAAAAADGALTAGSMFKVTNGNGTSALHIKD